MAFLIAIGLSCNTDRPIDQKLRACINTLERIDVAKRSMTFGFSIEQGATLTQDQIERLASYLPGGTWSQNKCPLGGEYTVGRIGEHASCSIHGTAKKARQSR